MSRTHGVGLVALLAALQLPAFGQSLTPTDVAGGPSDRRSLASPDHPAIGYSDGQSSDALSGLIRRLDDGALQLTHEPQSGYLGSVLKALGISTGSQIVVYSKTSIQAPRISPSNPRAIYFSDDVAVAYVRGAPFLEFAAVDSRRGVMFYTLDQRSTQAPRPARGTDCLRCHESLASMDIPGLLLRSVGTGEEGRIYPQHGNFVTDHRSPISERWGGWYVTGRMANAEHMGNLLLRNPRDPETRTTSRDSVLSSLETRFDQRGYPTPLSDVAALMIFEHQARMTNLIVRIGWDTRVALSAGAADPRVVDSLVANNAREFVDYLLFVDEAPLPGPVDPTAFSREFSERGPFDKKGRSLRQLDLQRRLMRYPCSYMIYSTAFDGLPDEARTAIYRRLWDVLSGAEKDARYARLRAADRRALIEILRDTKPDLPTYFK